MVAATASVVAATFGRDLVIVKGLSRPPKGSAQSLVSYRDYLHVISTDLMLMALGGFALVSNNTTPRDYHKQDKNVAYTDAAIRDIKRLAAYRPRQAPWGESKRIAEKHGIPYGSLTVRVHQIRNGRIPRYWLEVK